MGGGNLPNRSRCARHNGAQPPSGRRRGAKQPAARKGNARVPRRSRIKRLRDRVPGTVHGHPGDHLDDGSADRGWLFATTAKRRAPTPPDIAGDVVEIRLSRALDIDFAQPWQFPRAPVEQPDHRTLARQQIEHFTDDGGDFGVDIRRGAHSQGGFQDRPVCALTDPVLDEDGSRVHPAGAQRQRGEIDVAGDVDPERRGLHGEFEECLFAVGIEIESTNRELGPPGNVDDLRGTESVAGEDVERRGRNRGQPCKLLASQVGVRSKMNE